jgi:hypothetical protein
VPIRGLFRHFVATGVLPTNPFETSHSRKMQVAAHIHRLSAAPPIVDGQSFDQQRRALLATRSFACAYLKNHRNDMHVLDFVKHLDRELAGELLEERECSPRTSLNLTPMPAE